MTCLIEFNPLSPYFFGGEGSFGESRHYVHSEPFAQNTQLFGALRRYVLERAGLLRARKNGIYVRQKRVESGGEVEEALSLVGGVLKEGESDMGGFRSISPMFVVEKSGTSITDTLFPVPKDLYLDEGELRRWRMAKVGDELLPIDFDIKRYTPPLLGGRNFWCDYLGGSMLMHESVVSYDKVFLPQEQVGIALEEKRVIEGKFYRKTSYTLSDGYALAALLEVDERLEPYFENLDDETIQIGAEGVLFSMRSHALDSLGRHPVIQALTAKETPIGKKRIALGETILSDTHDPKIAYAFCPGYKTEKRIFHHKGRFEGKGSTVRLAPRGSVFFFDTDQGAIVAPQPFDRLGYNQFITIEE